MSADDIHYQWLNEQVANRSALIESKFDLFIKLISAVIAGTVWLSLQPGISAVDRSRYAVVSNVAVWWLIGMGMIMVWAHYKAWRGYRKAQSEHGPRDIFGNPKVPPPKLKHGLWTILPMFVAMAATAVGFAVFNPMKIQPPQPQPQVEVMAH